MCQLWSQLQTWKQPISVCVLLRPCIASAVSTICQVPQEESCLPECQVTGLPTLVSAFYPEAVQDPAPAPQLPQVRCDLACLRDPVEDAPSFTPDTGPLILVHLKILKQSMIQLQPILARVWGQFCLLRKLVGDMPICAPGRRPTDLSPSSRT